MLIFQSANRELKRYLSAQSPTAPAQDIALIETLAKETKLTHGELIRQVLETFAKTLK